MTALFRDQKRGRRPAASNLPKVKPSADWYEEKIRGVSGQLSLLAPALEMRHKEWSFSEAGEDSLSAHSLCSRLLLAITILAPLPLASNRPLPWSVLALAVGLLVAGWALLVARGRLAPGAPLKWFYPVLVPFAAALVWAMLQTLPGIPAGVANPLWHEAGQALGTGLPDRITIDAGRTMTGIMLLMTYGAIFFLSAQLGRHNPQKALVVLAGAGVTYALYGLVLWMLGSETILWMDKWAYNAALTSTFVNRNAYAAYAGLGLICCIALAVARAVSGGRGRLRDRVEHLLIQTLPWLVASILLGMALVLTHSRAGLLLTLTGLVILGVCLRIAGVIRNRAGLVFGLVLFTLVILVIFLGGEGTLKRLADAGLSDEARPLLYQATLGAFLDAPLTGQGLWSFPLIFPIHRDPALSMMQRFDHAHSLHLELLMELGLIASFLLYLSVAIILARCAMGLVRRQRNQIYPAVALAVTALLGLHGIVDFSLQMPAVAATYAFLLGLGFIQSFPTDSSGQNS